MKKEAKELEVGRMTEQTVNAVKKNLNRFIKNIYFKLTHLEKYDRIVMVEKNN
jgi:hypothetical protein